MKKKNEIVKRKETLKEGMKKLKQRVKENDKK